MSEVRARATRPDRGGSLAFSLRFQDTQLRVQLTQDIERYRLDEGDPLDIVRRGRPHRVKCDTPLELLTSSAARVPG